MKQIIASTAITTIITYTAALYLLFHPICFQLFYNAKNVIFLKFLHFSAQTLFFHKFMLY